MAEIAAAFVQHYYQTFDTNREALVALYADTSMMTFEGAQCLGVQAIGEKLKVRARASSASLRMGVVLTLRVGRLASASSRCRSSALCTTF